MGALTVGVVTKPFQFEGKRRMKNAECGINEFSECVDTIITIPNQKVLDVADDDMSMRDAFRRADDGLVQAVRGISDLIINAGMINVDFADVKTIMSATGRALMGTGYGCGETRAIDAAQAAINSPLLDDISVNGATGILINFTAGPDIKLKEINAAAGLIQEAAHEDANIIFGVVTDPSMTDLVKVTVIATGFDMQPAAQEMSGRPSRSTRPLTARQVISPSMTAPKRLDMPSVVTRSSAPPAMGRMESRESIVRPSRAPEVSVHASAPNRSARAFGAAAMHDEAVLDIPAYLRRSEIGQ
jgi:cell division protein FtsZ